MPAPRQITTVMHFINGMTMVFDQHGKQMPKYQGVTNEVLPSLRAAGWTEEVKLMEWPVEKGWVVE